MRIANLGLSVVLMACSSAGEAPRQAEQGSAQPPTTSSAVVAPVVERLTADESRATVSGATFIAPAGWSIVVRGNATILQPPEGDSHIALIDVRAKDADAAVAAAWQAYRSKPPPPLASALPIADKDGWSDRRQYLYRTSPDERRNVSAGVRRAGESWTVSIYDVVEATGEKRSAQIDQIFGRLFPKGYKRETFAGKKAHRLDEARVKELGAFVELAQKELGIPGAALGLVQDGKVVFEGGLGLRELGKTPKVGARTRFMVASNTKGLTTLMLAKLVDDGKLEWGKPVVDVLPRFSLGDAETTKGVQIKHLLCACTGLPRQDFDWLLEFKSATPDSLIAAVGAMRPTSKPGEMFQYSNSLAALGGFVGGHVHSPKLAIDAAYDEAMSALVFKPLEMKSTTFDFARALREDHAAGHAASIDDQPELAVMDINFAIAPLRPSGGAWSTVEDMLKYVSMELARGALPNGKRYISEKVLLERRAVQASMGSDLAYGMGLMIDTSYGVPVVYHTGSLIGFKTMMMWLPEHGVGAVLLTNADAGRPLLGAFRRKLQEVLFDGHPEADVDIATRAKAMHERVAAERKRLVFPAAADELSKLAPKYSSASLGELTVVRTAGKPGAFFDFGEWKSQVATRKNPDGTISFVTVTPGVNGFADFLPGTKDGKRTVVVRDAQHEYVFKEP